MRRHYSEAILPRRQVVEINCLLEPLVTSSDFSGYLFNPNPMLLLIVYFLVIIMKDLK